MAANTVKGTVVVLGGSRGIGKAMVGYAHERGYRVVYGGTKPLPEAEVQKLAAQDIYYHPVDVTNRLSVLKFRKFAMNHAPRGVPLSVIQNAGIVGRKGAEEIDAMYRVNVRGALNTVKEFGPYLRDSKDRLITLSSIVASRGLVIPGDEAYAETKELATEIARSLNDMSDGGKGFALAPGAVETDMTSDGLYPYLLTKLLPQLRVDQTFLAGSATYLKRTPTELAGMSNVDALRIILGGYSVDFPPELERVVERVGNGLDKDPTTINDRASLVLIGALNKNHDASLAVAGLLRSLGILITPQRIAEVLFSQIESGRIPKRGVLEAFARNNQEEKDPRILKLLKSRGAPRAEDYLHLSRVRANYLLDLHTDTTNQFDQFPPEQQSAWVTELIQAWEAKAPNIKLSERGFEQEEFIERFWLERSRTLKGALPGVSKDRADDKADGLLDKPAK